MQNNHTKKYGRQVRVYQHDYHFLEEMKLISGKEPTYSELIHKALRAWKAQHPQLAGIIEENIANRAQAASIGQTPDDCTTPEK